MNLKFWHLSILLLFVPALDGYGQERSYRIRTIAFYNLENLFDTIDDPGAFDEDFTPKGMYRWGRERFETKLQNLAEAIGGIGSAYRKGPPDILGLCEVENYEVLSDLVMSSGLEKYEYGIIHRDGPDERGIDVALVYKKNAFYPIAVQWHPLMIRNEDRFREFTRDQLVVHGYMDGLPLYLIVNHWPSRRGGELRSRPYRVAAAELNLSIIDSIRNITPEPLIIVMGDFNDNPTDYSFQRVLRIKSDETDVGRAEFYNPMVTLFRKGKGSLAYRDTWSLFDQIYMSGNLVNGNSGLKFWKAGIHDPAFLTQLRGAYRGYPYRTYSLGRYSGGYSDHFPVYACFVKEVMPLLGND